MHRFSIRCSFLITYYTILSTKYTNSVYIHLSNYIVQESCCDISFLHIYLLETVGSAQVSVFSFLICQLDLTLN